MLKLLVLALVSTAGCYKETKDDFADKIEKLIRSEGTLVEVGYDKRDPEMLVLRYSPCSELGAGLLLTMPDVKPLVQIGGWKWVRCYSHPDARWALE